MNKYLFFLTRFIAVVASFAISISLFIRDYVGRSFLNLILLSLFIVCSFLFENKRKKITVSYIFVFFIIFIVNSLVPAFYTEDIIRTLDSTDKCAGLIKDNFYIYFFSVVICYFVIIAYLVLSKKKVVKTQPVQCSTNESGFLLIGAIVLFIAYFFLDKLLDMLVPVVAMLIFLLIIQKKHKIRHLIFLVLMFTYERRLLEYRYIFVCVVLPTLFGILFYFCKNRRINIIKMFLITLLLAMLFFAYGIISEVYKLNEFYGGHYNITDVIKDSKMIFKFAYNQIYRLFVIWLKLGGYAIYHAQNYGFFYGITYIKSFSSLFGFEYVSLPSLVASYHGSNYAQPGLLAEGFANFGIFGAIINILLVFFVMEYFYDRFYHNNSLANFMLMTVPFTTILLDGGTLNSAIVFIVITILLCNCSLFTYRGNFLLPLKKGKRNAKRKLL